MLESLQKTADACTDVCMRAVEEERQALKVHLAQEQLLYMLQDEHRRLLGAMNNIAEVRQPTEAKVFNLSSVENSCVDGDRPSHVCSEVDSPVDAAEGAHDSVWDVPWSAISFSQE